MFDSGVGGLSVLQALRNDTFDLLIDAKDSSTLFSTPNMPVGFQDHFIGLHASTLVRDGGTLQIGIGSMGDALTAALLARQADNARYRALLGAQADGAATATTPEGIALARIPLGKVTLVLQSPAPNAVGESSAAQALRERLSTRGEGPCAFTLRSDHHALPATPNLSATHGVALAWQH